VLSITKVLEISKENLFQHFGDVKKFVVEKYAKPKIFMPTTSKKWQI